VAVPAYRTPDERFEGLPGWTFAPRYVEQDGLRLHYVDEGAGAPILLLHGEPTWGFLYRKLIPRLASIGRVVAPDYLGFGRSDKPTEGAWYSYDAHYRSIERLVCEQLDLARLTVVVQDWGGPIGLRLAVEHEDRVERLVVLNTGVGARPPGEAWLRFQAFMRRVGSEIVAGRLVRRSCATELPDAVVAGYDAPFPVPEARTGIVMFPELVATSPDHPSAAAMLAVRDALARWEKPALVLFGDSDPIFPPAHAERMAALIPGAGPAELVAGASHLLQEDRGEEVAERIAGWLGPLS
jgi:haloalkane dehalogenase